MKLSILIAGVYDRNEKRAELLRGLERQATAGVEILVIADGRESPLAQKCNRLMDAARGEYLCFIDDDDMVPEYYVAEILAAVAAAPDAVGFIQDHWTDGVHTNFCIHSIRRERVDPRLDGVEWHAEILPKMCPMRREIAATVRFDEGKRKMEDYEWAWEVNKLLRTEVFIDRVMYTYRWSTTDTLLVWEKDS